jgi:uncharacterized protein YegP (UPF0339 family)
MRLIIATIAASLLISSAAIQNPAPARGADQKAVAESATFEVYKDKAGEYRWRLKAGNGQNIASSGEGYAEKRSCLAAIESVKRHAPNAPVEEK